MKFSLMVAALVLTSLGLAGCNTVEGFGKDLETAGKKISTASEKEKNSSPSDTAKH